MDSLIVEYGIYTWDKRKFKAFKDMLTSMTFTRFCICYCEESWGTKKCRNAYDNRMRNTNLVCYYVIYTNAPKKGTKSTQTGLRQPYKDKPYKIMTARPRDINQVPSST